MLFDTQLRPFTKSMIQKHVNPFFFFSIFNTQLRKSSFVFLIPATETKEKCFVSLFGFNFFLGLPIKTHKKYLIIRGRYINSHDDLGPFWAAALIFIYVFICLIVPSFFFFFLCCLFFSKKKKKKKSSD